MLQIRLTLEMVSMLLGERPAPLAWEAIKNLLRRDDFLSRVSVADPFASNPKLAARVESEYISSSELSPAKLAKVPRVCSVLYDWAAALVK